LQPLSIHIVSFDVPYPADYGGVIDVFWRIVFLSKVGVKIHLHCFYDKRIPSEELEKYCEKVYYYPRKLNFISLFKGLPYIVSSRINNGLIKNLKKDDFPILLEGLHTCGIIPFLKGRKIAVRMHNIESDYYRKLGEAETRFFYRFYNFIEAFLLKRFEKILKEVDMIWAISPQDTAVLYEKYPQTAYLPAFHPDDEVRVGEGLGEGCLYHGNLSVAENHLAAMFLVETLKDHFPFIIAGKNPRPELYTAAQKYKKVNIIKNPSEKEMKDLIARAQVHVLPTFQQTGIKLKLLNVLFNGRHIIVNPEMVSDQDLSELCTIIKNESDWISIIQQKMNQYIDEIEIKKRSNILKNFNPKMNAEIIKQWLSID